MSSIRIQIVEDDPLQAEELQAFLEELGYTITGMAASLPEAFGLFYSQQPDLVIVDIYLAGKPDGIAFAQRLLENRETRRPCIFLTSHATPKLFEQARLAAPYSYLVKPFNPPELQYAIELALEKFAGELGQFSLGTGAATAWGHALFVKREQTLVKVPFATVRYVEVAGKFSHLNTGQGDFLIQWPLKKLLDKLLPHGFIQIHRNYLVHHEAVVKVELADQQVVLEGGKTLPFSQSFRKELLARLDILK